MKTTEEIRAMLENACNETGSQASWAKMHDLSAQFICDVLLNRRAPGKRIAAVFGHEPVTMYQPISKEPPLISDCIEDAAINITKNLAYPSRSAYYKDFAPEISALLSSIEDLIKKIDESKVEFVPTKDNNNEY